MSTGPSASVNAVTAALDLRGVGHVGRRHRDLAARGPQRRGAPRRARRRGARAARPRRRGRPRAARSRARCRSTHPVTSTCAPCSFGTARDRTRAVQGWSRRPIRRAAMRRPIAPISTRYAACTSMNHSTCAEHERPHEHDALVERREADHRLEPGGVLREREERRREQEQRDERERSRSRSRPTTA